MSKGDDYRFHTIFRRYGTHNAAFIAGIEHRFEFEHSGVVGINDPCDRK